VVASAALQKHYPFEGKVFDRQGLRLHYLDEGSGETVVMVHGNPSWSFYYRNLVLALRGQYRCIVPDHIGMGLSDKPGDDRYEYTLKSRVDDLEALLESLNLKDITLVVHDWGGMIGMAYAVRHPEKIKRLVILNTAAFPLPTSKLMPWQLSLVRDSGIGAFLVRGFNAFARGAASVGCTQHPMPKDVRDAYCAPYDSWANRIATARFVQDIPLKDGDRGFDIVKDTEQKLAQFCTVPTLICWGARDFVFDDHFLNEWKKHLPQAEVHRFPEAGHYVLEDVGNEVIPLVQQFLSRNPLRAAS
jgi:haloalkane dehalogenase